MKLPRRVTINEVIVVFFILFVGMSYFLPETGSLENAKLLLSAIAIIFSILAGFAISSLWSRFTRMRELLSIESGELESLYKMSQFIGSRYAEIVREIIDKYLVKAFDYDLWAYQEHVNREFFSLFDSLKNISVTDDKQKQALGKIFNILDNLGNVRKEIFTLGSDRLKKHEWMSLIVLSGLLIATLFYVKEETLISMVFTILLSTGIVLIVAVIRELDDMEWDIETIGYEIYEQVFDLIGKPRYFPEEGFLKKRNMKTGNYYRVGLADNQGHTFGVKYIKDGKEIKQERINNEL
ncbi:DUF4239 domain-containing protein [Candidatus Woesearchaeota archaeon]|jgi:hypothetical protein|nr:DUF4239 domain-containing protein [Candidatus Woesearchaeota archaeon]MBT4114556.1 DUF4239 domain-containing protein [Candidatus Woesearchaeota archaeon]MBT4248094.1 DUF4239 domain-containing protein [Candidatus Woesearchaeota archaeon]